MSKWKKSASMLAAVLILVSVFAAVIPGAANPDLSVSIGSGGAAPDETTNVLITINNIYDRIPVTDNITSVGIHLYFDPDVVHFEGAVAGSGLAPIYHTPPATANANGEATISGMNFLGEPGNDINFATVTLKAVGNETENCTLCLWVETMTAYTAGELTPMPVYNGTFTVTGAAAPDTTPPTTTYEVTPTPNAAGWNNVTPVNVTFFRSDNGGSGVDYTNLSTSETGPWMKEEGEEPFNMTISIEGETTIYYYSVDKNETPNVETTKNMTVRIDTAPPAINIEYPENGVTDVSVTTDIAARFVTVSPMNSSMLTTETVIVANSTEGLVAGTVTYNDAMQAVIFNPTDDLEYNETYNVTIMAGVENLAGNAMVGNYSWVFTTAETTVPVLTSIVISPPNATLNVNEAQLFTATAYDQDGNPLADINITWASNNTAVGNVSPSWNITDENGNATTTFNALAEGTTTIVAANLTALVYNTSSVTVVYEPVVTTIGVEPSTAMVQDGSTEQFTATAYDQGGIEMPDVTFAWSVSNATVGTVNETTGLFTALAAGDTLVNATAGSVTGNATVTVYEEPEVTTIGVEPPIAMVQNGSTEQFTATAYDQGGNPMADINITWNSSSTSVGNVSPSWSITDENGTAVTTFNALAEGNTAILAYNGTVFDGAIVTVYEELEVTTIEVEPSTAMVQNGSTEQFTATAYDQGGNPVADVNITWNSSSTSVGNVSPSWSITDENGTAATTFNALAEGNTAILAYNGTVLGGAIVTVYEHEVTTIVVEPSTAMVQNGRTEQFTATAYDLGGNPVADVNITWNSSSTSVGNVSPSWSITDENGNATTTFNALAEGNTAILAYNGTVFDGAIVTVYEPEVTTIEVAPSEAMVSVGGTEQFNAIAYDQLGIEMSAVFAWSVSNDAVGTVNETTGLFTASAAGDTLVNATADSVNGSATVRVVQYGVELWVDGKKTATETIDTDETARYTLTVKNTGSEADTIALTKGTGEKGTLSDTSVPLAPDESKSVTLEVSSTTTGTYTTTVTATSVGGPTDSVTVTTEVESKRRPSGGGGVPRDSDGDGYSDVQEMIADTDENDPCDPDLECAACLATKPAATPTPTPTVTPTVTPTPTMPPTVTTPTPTPEEPGFEAVFAIAGLLAVAYLVLRRKRK